MGNLGGWRGLTIWSDETRTRSVEGEHAELLQVRVLQPRVGEENEREALSAGAESMHTILDNWVAFGYMQVFILEQGMEKWESGNKEVKTLLSKLLASFSYSPLHQLGR